MQTDDDVLAFDVKLPGGGSYSIRSDGTADVPGTYTALPCGSGRFASADGRDDVTINWPWIRAGRELVRLAGEMDRWMAGPDAPSPAEARA